MMEALAEALKDIDGIAGLAALINGLILWPIVRGHQRDRARQDKRIDDHDTRIKKLETP